MLPTGVILAIVVAEGLLRLALPSALDVHPPGMYTTHPDVGYVLTPGFQGELVRPEFQTQISIGSDFFQTMKTIKSNIVGFMIYTVLLFGGYFFVNIVLFKGVLGAG